MQSIPPVAFARRLFPCLSVALALLVARPALGDPGTEKQALALQKKALEEDSLNVNYPAAIKKLATAISKCDGDKCTPSLKGALYRDLGAMLILGGSVDDGRAAFVKALGMDATLELDLSYKSPMIEGLWNDAKKKAGVSGGAPTAAGASPGANGAGETATLPEASAAPTAAGDFAHVPAAAQLVRTPLPVYAEYVGTEKLLRVVVKYRGAGMTDWKPVELRKMDAGYGGLIPCKDVAEGTMQYYVQGYGTSDDPVASSGSRTKPYSVPIKRELTGPGPGPSLPGQDAPRQCAESAGGTDCPPDFPGCHVQKKGAGDECRKNGECESGQCASGKCVEKKGEGDECENDVECASGSCADEKCTAPEKGANETCDSDDDCSGGTCKDGKCNGEGTAKRSKSSTMRRIWIGLAVSMDFVPLPAATDVCKLSATGHTPFDPHSPGYQCVDPTTSANFPGAGAPRVSPGMLNDQIATGSAANGGDAITGGFVSGNLRIMATFDYAVNMNLLLGARAGLVLFTDPASNPGPAFVLPPLHLEARVTYLVGKDALTKSIAPMIFLAAGAGEFDANFAIQVRMTTGRTNNENAWLTAGPFFGAAGLGARFLASKGVAITAAVKGQGAFGGSAGSMFGVAPELGAQLGF